MKYYDVHQHVRIDESVQKQVKRYDALEVVLLSMELEQEREARPPSAQHITHSVSVRLFFHRIVPGIVRVPPSLASFYLYVTAMDDAEFRREYAKSLAEALAERDQEQAPNHDIVNDTYVSLCFDDPRVQTGDEGCRLLASALVKKDSPVRISDPLVEGLKQATGRTLIHSAAAAAAAADKEENDDNNEQVLLLQPGGVATAAGYALLVFTCFVKIPLHCCQSKDMNTVKDFLGSYRGPKRRQKEDLELEKETLVDEDEEKIQALSQGLSDMAVHDYSENSLHEKQEKHTDYEEVWAAESDPSGFEYESGHDPQQALNELDQWTEAFDPIALSKPPTSTDWIDLRQAVANLLSELSYSKLAPLSKQQWNSLRVSDLLSQLTLTLLIQPDNASTKLLDEELQKLGIQPLFALRDRVASHGNVLGDYLTLVQTLVAVDAAEPTRTAASLAPATIVGLGALSALCYATEYKNNPDAPQRIRQCVLETCEDLSHIMEKSRDSSVHLMWTLLPLLDRLTNVTPEGYVWESSSSFLCNADAQLLLQSGMFRELILLYSNNNNTTEPASEAPRAQLLRSIEIMCVQSTLLLGKYAWRVPDLAKIVQTDEFAREHVVDGIVWNLLGSTLAGGPVRLNIKNVPVVTAEECRARVLAGFQGLCEDAEAAMKTIHSLRTQKNRATDDDAWKEPITELSRFSNYLISFPSLAILWRNTATSNDDALQQVKKTVDSIRQSLSKLPRIPVSGESKTAKSADNDKAGDPLKRPASTYGEHEEALVRKSIKILSASWQSGRDSTSSKTD